MSSSEYEVEPWLSPRPPVLPLVELLLKERLLSCILLFPVSSSASAVVIFHLVHFRHLSVQARVSAPTHASREPASTAA